MSIRTALDYKAKKGASKGTSMPSYPIMEVPDSVMLPLCAVQHSSCSTFLLKNASKLQTCFQWKCEAPFQLSPEQGQLKPGQECHIKVVFQPQEALVYQQQAYCWFGKEMDQTESCCTVLLQAPAKYPYLQLKSPSTEDKEEPSTLSLHFGSVAIGRRLRKHFDIFNPSPVTVSFTLSRLSGGIPPFGEEFRCNVTEGQVAPGESLRARVTYSPAVVDAVSVEYLSLKCMGGLSEPLLRLTGKCIGPSVSLSSSVVDFGCVEEGGTVIGTVDLVNSSPAEAVYQWDIDCCGNSVFSILPASGTVPPHSLTTLRAVYSPTQPIAHHRRVACLILHRDPVFLDLIGTCHSDLQKPAILKPEHLVPYMRSPDQQDEIIHLDQQGVDSPAKEQQRPDGDAVVSTMEECYQTCLGCMDPLSSSSSLSSLHVTVEPTELLFNHKTTSFVSTSSAFSQFVSIRNHTRENLSLVWTISQDSPFSVVPSSCDLTSLKSTAFRVNYDPKQLNTLHGAQLECFAYNKDNRGVEDGMLRLPRCVTIRVIGHSFQLGTKHFMPCCSLKPPQVVFPGLSVISYRTVLLQNDGDLPLTFCLDHSSNPALGKSIFVAPSCGLIQAGDHQILTLGAMPREDSPKQGFTLRLQLNAANFTKELTVVSVLENPCVSLEGVTTLYLEPTAVGSKTQRTHHIRNFSRLPISFQWSIPEPAREIIIVEPDAGELHPNESSIQTWSFSPFEKKRYELKPTLFFWPIQTDGSNKSYLSLKVVGRGSDASIEAQNAALDMGDIQVGSCHSVEVPLVNNSPCPVYFRLSVQQLLVDDEINYNPEAEPNAIQLDCEKGTIASHTTMQLQCTVRPQRGVQYLWKFSYQTMNANGFVLCLPQTLCEVRARGVFPTLQVIDGCGGGSVVRLSKAHLWKLFSLDSFNEQLLSNPSPAELTFKYPTSHSLHSCPSMFTQPLLDFNFSSSPVNSDASSVTLMFHNPGSIPVDWAFLFPEDQHIELEYWAVTGEFSSTELHHMKVQDNQLFSISPRSGTLLPDQRRAVHFSYRHEFVGTHRLPVVFKLSYGRELMLIFQGVTVGRNRPCLRFASNRHVFTPVTIGDGRPPRQVYELHNGGAVPARYKVDTAVLSQLQMDNFNHPVLRCLNPEGEVLPGKTAWLEWIFSPIEAKMYHMDVPIHNQNGDSTLVRFEGCGHDTSTLGSPYPLTGSDSKASAPCVQRVPFPGQALFLSEDRVFLGDIPVNSQSSRILFLTNVSYTDTILYTWDLAQQNKQQVVQLDPDHGCLGPGECALSVLTFTSTGCPSIYQLDLICQVFQEAALFQYQDALKQWKKDRMRQQDEFATIDENIQESQLPAIVEEHLADPARQGPLFTKYKTLPPISASTPRKRVVRLCNQNQLNEIDQLLQQEMAKVRKRPEPPQPALLHLEVAAHSRVPDQSIKHSRYLQPVQTPAGLSSPTQGPEKDIHGEIFTSLLRYIVDDSDFMTLPFKPTAYKPTTPSSDCSSSSPRPAVRPTSCSAPTPQLQLPLNGPEDKEKEGTAECLEKMPQTQNTPQTEWLPADMSEDVLLNILQNLMMEAVRGEFDMQI